MCKGRLQKWTKLRFGVALWVIFSLSAGVNDISARPTDQDYYAAAGSEELHFLLWQVESAHTSMIFNAIMEKNYGQAKGDLDYTLVTFPNHPEALQLLILFASVSRSPSFANPYFERAIQLYPQYSMTHFLYGMFLTKFGILKEAVREFKKALEIEPNLTLAYVWLAKAYDKAGDKEAARESAQKAVEMGYRGPLLDDLVKKVP